VPEKQAGDGESAQVVAITGSLEFFGSGLVDRLESDPRYRKILAIDVRAPSASGHKVTFCPVDLTTPEAGHELAALFRSNRVNTVVHLAFLSHPIHDTAYAHELQVIGTMHVLNAVAAAQRGKTRVKKVVMLSSTMVYGARPDNPNFLQEDRPLKKIPNCPFVNDLVEAEEQLHQFANKHPKVNTTVLRMGCLLGPRVDGVLPRLLACSTVPSVMGYDPLFQFLHETDALDALKLALDQDQEGIFNIVAEGVLPFSTVLRLGGKVSIPIPHFLWEKVSGFLWAFQALDIPPSFLDFLRYLWMADGTKARRRLGFSPRFTTRETLLEFVRSSRLSQAPAASGTVMRSAR
jgi:UDP-glucose 4-epimerase